MLTTSNLKVKSFYIRFICGRFYKLVLQHEICTFSSSELRFKGTFHCIWKTWKVNEVDWGPSPSTPNVLHLITTSLWAHGKEESKSNTFWMLDLEMQDITKLQRLSRLHPDSILGVQVLDGKLIKSTIVCICTHIHIIFEAATIINLYLFLKRVRFQSKFLV